MVNKKVISSKSRETKNLTKSEANNLRPKSQIIDCPLIRLYWSSPKPGFESEDSQPDSPLIRTDWIRAQEINPKIYYFKTEVLKSELLSNQFRYYI